MMQQLSPEERDLVAVEWRARRTRERPTQPVEDRPPPIVVRGLGEPIRRVELAEVSS